MIISMTFEIWRGKSADIISFKDLSREIPLSSSSVDLIKIMLRDSRIYESSSF